MKDVGDAAGSKATNAHMQVVRRVAAVIAGSRQHAHASRAAGKGGSASIGKHVADRRAEATANKSKECNRFVFCYLDKIR